MINYSEQYFGKDLIDLSYEDIVNFFAVEKEESDKIEFKAFHPDFGNFNKNLEGVIRGICAFLNSNGGILIWGAPLGQKVDERVIFQGALSPVTELKEKDSLISKISDSITPLPVNINVNIIKKEDNYLYVFETQISNYSPHQFKNTYFARLDGQTKPAPHYLVEALFKKISYPNIEGYINLDRYRPLSNGQRLLDISILMFNFSELQNAYNLTYRLMCVQGIFAGSQNQDTSKYYTYNGHMYVHKDLNDILHFGAPDRNTQRIIFNMDKLADNHNCEMDLILTFGGKNSPLKLSEYKLDFGKGSIAAKNPVGLFKSKNENKLVSVHQKEIGSTRENQLKKMLKR
ncbi:ATP-binding protein [Aquimarina algicola]|uniref:ATP-binding protein n=1 Tax=Aquimarina algicola TaxID=2589995 RepID=A0A504J5L0_9FLAO|nr:ATP-binding protein [Aquimarina algicola]TPN85804.1 ATP-binding protein [Aquimarina algicola]